MTIVQSTDRTVSTQDLRDNLADHVRDAQYGARIDVTRNGKLVARLVGPDAGRMPDPDLWQAAQENFDRLRNTADLPLNASRALASLGALLAAHYGYDQEG